MDGLDGLKCLMNGWIGLDIYQKKLVDSNGLF
jgi:hypothetical protein